MLKNWKFEPRSHRPIWKAESRLESPQRKGGGGMGGCHLFWLLTVICQQRWASKKLETTGPVRPLEKTPDSGQTKNKRQESDFLGG